MTDIEKLKLSNEVSIKILKNDFPINGRAVITINVKDSHPESVEVKNVKASKGR